MAIEDGASWFCSYGLLLHELIMCVCVCVHVRARVCVKVPSSGTQLKLCVPEHTIILKDPGLNSGLVTPWQGHPAPKTSWCPAGESAPGHQVLSAFTSASISSVSSPGLLGSVVSAATSCSPSWPLHGALCLVLCACTLLGALCFLLFWESSGSWCLLQCVPAVNTSRGSQGLSGSAVPRGQGFPVMSGGQVFWNSH